MHFHVWNHRIPCVELHGRTVGHGSMHGIVWNHTDHMLPCMELHGSLINLDPGRVYIFERENEKRTRIEINATRKLSTRRSFSESPKIESGSFTAVIIPEFFVPFALNVLCTSIERNNKYVIAEMKLRRNWTKSREVFTVFRHCFPILGSKFDKNWKTLPSYCKSTKRKILGNASWCGKVCGITNLFVAFLQPLSIYMALCSQQFSFLPSFHFDSSNFQENLPLN